MTFVRHQVTVQAPATSANLGPGFDALGLALSLYDRVTGEVVGDGLAIEVRGEGAEEVPRDSSHLLYRSMAAAFDLLGETPRGLRLTCENAIPHGRGMGSSAAAITSGIVLARALVEGGHERLDDRSVLQLATDLEGHPDNVAAALAGGLTIAWVDGAAADAIRLDVDAAVTVFVPPDSVPTEAARKLLPEQVDHADAAFNAGRAALLVAALREAPERLISATEDRLHQAFRSEAMPGSYRLLRQLRVEGVPAVISGAGPTVLAFAQGIRAAAPEGWAVHELSVSPRGTCVIA